MIAFIDDHRAVHGGRADLPGAGDRPVDLPCPCRAPGGPSVGSVGDSYDNALAETVIGLFKTEVIHRLGPWRNRDAVEISTLEWAGWFNTRRLLEPIGHIPPAEAENRHYAELATRMSQRRTQANLPPGKPARFTAALNKGVRSSIWVGLPKVSEGLKR